MFKLFIVYILLLSFFFNKQLISSDNVIPSITTFGIDQNNLSNFDEYQSAILENVNTNKGFDADLKFYENNSFSVVYGIEYLNNNLYITDCPNSIVKVFNSKGKFLYNLNEKYNIPKIDYPSGITSNGKNILYIIEEKKSRLIVVNIETGEYSYVDFIRDKNRKIKFDNPLSIDFLNDKLFLTDTQNNRILIFDTNFKLIENLNSFKLNYNNLLGISKSTDVPISYPYYIRALSEDQIIVNVSGWNRYVELFLQKKKYEKSNFLALNIFGNKPDDWDRFYKNFVYDKEFDAPNDLIYIDSIKKLVITVTNNHSMLFFDRVGGEWLFDKEIYQRNVKVLEYFETNDNIFLVAYGPDKSGLGVINIYELN